MTSCVPLALMPIRVHEGRPLRGWKPLIWNGTHTQIQTKLPAIYQLFTCLTKANPTLPRHTLSILDIGLLYKSVSEPWESNRSDVHNLGLWFTEGLQYYNNNNYNIHYNKLKKLEIYMNKVNNWAGKIANTKY